MGLNLLEKTELWVNEITLANANLSDMADAVAERQVVKPRSSPAVFSSKLAYSCRVSSWQPTSTVSSQLSSKSSALFRPTGLT